jgi:hypothetical protein
MKLLFNLFIPALFLSLMSIAEAADKNNPVISLSADLKTLSETSYSIEYKVNISGIDASAFMDQKISYPYDASIIEGMIMDRKINEKDFLYSERNIDLNGDGDIEDSFPVSYKSDSIAIDGIRVNPLFRKAGGNSLLIPFDSSSRENSIRIKPEGQLFAIHTYEPLIGKIKAMLAESPGTTIFREFPNSLLIVELIHNNGEELDNLTIERKKPEKSFTNEKEFSHGGENLKRSITGINLNLQDNFASGTIKIDNIREKFKVRLLYLFSISRRTVLINEKILLPVK